ncbi:MAG: AAA family ATPase [Candidatus Schekmanbacteria bacterium]|nr:AAA family ATPase [Candidatus Schekmanbacteria bacterium]
MISARLEHGDRARWFQQAAEKTNEGPDGRPLRVSPRTIEDWHGAWRRGGLQALKPKKRAAAGSSRVIEPEIGELILQMKRERPRRSIHRIIRMLKRADEVAAGRLKKSTVHRSLQSRGQSARPRRGDDERRFAMLARQPGIGVLTGEVGVGKTAAIRHLAAGLPRPDYRVIYLCDASTEAADLHRELAAELGLRPAHGASAPRKPPT